MTRILIAARDYQTPRRKRLASKARRDDLIARGLCLNGESHGPAMHGRRCWDCVATHQRHDLLPTERRVRLAALRLARELKGIGCV